MISCYTILLSLYTLLLSPSLPSLSSSGLLSSWYAKSRGVGQWRGKPRERGKEKAETHQALSLFPIDWSFGVGGHWRAKVRGWLHERRVTEWGEGPGEVRPGVRLRHDRKWGGCGWSAGEGRICIRKRNGIKIRSRSIWYLPLFWSLFLLENNPGRQMRGTESRNAPCLFPRSARMPQASDV